jgi:glycosyltransferase involved in cell wall biosynthesis
MSTELFGKKYSLNSTNSYLGLQVALLTDEYLPDGTRVHSKMFHELAQELALRGHKPVVITPGNRRQKSILDISYFEGIETWRFKSAQTRGVGLFRRAFTEYLLSFRAWLAIKSILRKRKFDLCINYSPTIFFGPLAKKFKNRGAYVYLVLRDFFPQWIIDEGLIKENSIPAKFFRYYEHLNYRTSDCIALQSEANLQYFKKINPHYNNCKILMNWASADSQATSNNKFSIRKELNLNDKIIFFYGGNMGKAQDMGNILTLIENLIGYEEIHFLLVGSGDEFDLVLERKKKLGLKNLSIMNAVSQEKFKAILADIDVGLFSLSFKHSAHNFPGKLLGYMVESVPILGSVNPGNDLLTVINESKSGMVHINGEDNQLVQSALRLANSETLRTKLGLNSKKLLLNKFSVQSITSQILKEFEKSKY